MSVYNREGLAHSRKVITSSMRSTNPPCSIEAAFQSSVKEARRKLSESVSAGHLSSMFHFRQRGFSQFNDGYLRNLQNVLEVRQTPTVFVSISKPSVAIDRLLSKRKTDHDDAVRNMKNELASSYTACEQEFKNRSITVKIQINGFRKEIRKVTDKLREINLLDLDSKDCDIAWKKVSALIKDEKQVVDRFYSSLLIIEKKRQEYAKSILQKYYKIFHKTSFLLPYEIQVYLENEILNYNEAVLGNHRTYADLHLQMRLLADTAKIRFQYLIEELKIDSCEAMSINNNY